MDFLESIERKKGRRNQPTTLPVKAMMMARVYCFLFRIGHRVWFGVFLVLLNIILMQLTGRTSKSERD